jgi:hypothetical protein
MKYISNPQVELQELTSLLERLSLATNSSSDGSSRMEAQGYVQYELDFDLNNPYEVAEEDVWDVLGSIGGTSNVSDDECEGEECEVELNPFHLIVTCNLVLVPLEGTWNHVHVMCPSMWVCWCRLRKYLQVMHADESHQRTIDSYFTRDL